MVSEKRKEQNREAQRKHREKKRAERVRIVGPRTELRCVKCERWKDEDNFRKRGRGRDEVCLDCQGGRKSADEHPGFDLQDQFYAELRGKAKKG